MSELLPCPFCGSKASVLPTDSESNYFAVICEQCEAEGPRHPLPTGAEDEWNRRPAPAARLREALEKLRERLLPLAEETGDYVDIETIDAALSSAPSETCEWDEDYDGVWSTTCGHSWCFDTDGTPQDHHMEFCPFSGCGRPIHIAEKET